MDPQRGEERETNNRSLQDGELLAVVVGIEKSSSTSDLVAGTPIIGGDGVASWPVMGMNEEGGESLSGRSDPPRSPSFSRWPKMATGDERTRSSSSSP